MNYLTRNYKSIRPSEIDAAWLERERQYAREDDDLNWKHFQEAVVQLTEATRLVSVIFGTTSAEYRAAKRWDIPMPPANSKALRELEMRWRAFQAQEAERERQRARRQTSAAARADREARAAALSEDTEQAVVELLSAGMVLGVDFHLADAEVRAFELGLSARSDEAQQPEEAAT